MAHVLDRDSDLVIAQQLEEELSVTPEPFLQYPPDQPGPIVLDIRLSGIGVPEQVWREPFHRFRKMGGIGSHGKV